MTTEAICVTFQDDKLTLIRWLKKEKKKIDGLKMHFFKQKKKAYSFQARLFLSAYIPN